MRSSVAIQRQPPLPKLIEASWQRCRELGMASHWQVDQTALTKPALHLQQEQNRQMRKLALREMNILERALANSGRILLLADPSGLILDSQGDDRFLGRAARVSLNPGASWRERAKGTNAIGTAIVERRFVQVVGAQHFFDDNRFLACNAMPIFSPTGNLAGVLDISGLASDNTFAAASRLVRHAAAHVEHDWVEESATDLLVRIHHHPSWLGTPEEGILSFHDDLLTTASSRGLAYLGLTPLAIGHAQWHDLFEQKPAYGKQELQLRHMAGFCYANVSRASLTAAYIAATEPAHAGPETFRDLKDEVLRRAVTAENGNITAAALKLGINRSTFYRRIKREQSGGLV